MPAQGPDHLNMSPTRDESPDNIDTLKKQRLARAQNEIGAKVLTLAGLEYALEKGVRVDDIVSKLDSYDIAKNLDSLINHGANIDIDRLVSELRPYDIAENLDPLISHGAKVDIDSLVSKLSPSDIVYSLDSLVRHGANID